MKIEKVNINSLISPEYNPREISDEEMEKLKTSIQEFGYVDPLIVNEVNQHIVGGNQRYLALKELGYEEVDVVYIHEDDPNREKALNIALNKISGQWDFSKLTDIFKEMNLNEFNTNFTGFDELEIENMLYTPHTDYDYEDNNDYEDIGDEEVDRSIEEAFESIFNNVTENEKEKVNSSVSDNRIISFYTADEDLYYKFLNFLGLNSVKLDKRRNIRLEELECLKELDMD